MGPAKSTPIPRMGCSPLCVSRLIKSSLHASRHFLARSRALEVLAPISSIWLVSHLVGGYPTRTSCRRHLWRAFFQRGSLVKPDRVDRRFLRLFPGCPFLSAQRLKSGSWLEFRPFLCPRGLPAVLICPLCFPVAVWSKSEFLHLKSQFQLLTSDCWTATCTAWKLPHQRLLWLSSLFLTLGLLSSCHWWNHLRTTCALSPPLVPGSPFCIDVDVLW